MLRATALSDYEKGIIVELKAVVESNRSIGKKLGRDHTLITS